MNHLFWQHPINIPEKLCLIHSEISEALEALRLENSIGEELADAVIRIMDLAEYLDIDLNQEIFIKHNINKTRPIKNNKKF